MLFNSFPFLILFILTFGFYYFPILAKFQVHLLVLASLVFYSYQNPGLLILLLASCAINTFLSYYVVYGKPSRRKLYVTLGVIANLSILVFFKYSPLIASTLFPSPSSIGDFLISIPLPIGISFYTFEGITLLVDVYRDKYKSSEKIVSPSLPMHVRNTLLFISFFPHLVAGPVIKAHDFLPQIQRKYINDIDWNYAVKQLIMGFFLKMVVADNLKDFTYWIGYYPYFESFTTVDLIAMLLGYSFQIFADFAGYSLIAIGLASLFGYKLMDNFNFPYISASFKEFWKRWHISLSSFLMNYLYIPLGGNRKGELRTYANLILTMLLGGLWHGAAWSYMVWGLFHGLALAVERAVTKNKPETSNRYLLTAKRFMVFIFVTLAWLLFKQPEFSHVVSYLRAMGNNFSYYFDEELCLRIFIYSLPVIVYHLFYLYKESRPVRFAKRFEPIIYAFLLFLILTSSGSAGSFIYFQF